MVPVHLSDPMRILSPSWAENSTERLVSALDQQSAVAVAESANLPGLPALFV